MDGNNVGKCPVMHGAAVQATNQLQSNREWWPNQLNLKVLGQNAPQSDPFGGTVDYAEEFKKLDLKALKADLTALMTDSQEWWPADYGEVRQPNLMGRLVPADGQRRNGIDGLQNLRVWWWPP